MQKLIDFVKQRPDQAVPWITLGLLLLALVWSFWNSLTTVAASWDDPRYSHGYLVPLFACAFLWIRREPFRATTWQSRSWGLGLLAAALAMRLLATHFDSRSVEMISFVPAVAALFVLTGGWSALRWASPAIVFLVFMYPVPGALYGNLSERLQRIATSAGTYGLQTLGVGTYAEGNRIVIGELKMNVVEACSGLRMLTIFIAMTVALAMLSKRPLWERLVVVASSVPIALAVNVFRITMTGILHLTAGTEIADQVFHDLAGWVMMPLALGLLYLEFQILAHLFVEQDDSGGPITIGSGGRRAKVAAVSVSNT